MSPISSDFSELSMNSEYLEFKSQISSAFLSKALEKPDLYSRMVADVEMTHARSTARSTLTKAICFEVNLEY